MKSIVLAMGIIGFLTNFLNLGSKSTDGIQAIDTGYSIYDISIRGIDSQVIKMSDFKGKYVVIVNTASECGYTGQYKDLEEFYERYKDSNIVVLGCPCNEFGGQEPGTETEIAGFCKKNYGVTFPMTEKIIVKDSSTQHPLYQWLTKKEKNGVGNFAVKWNFNKFIISPQGRLLRYFGSKVKPGDSLFLDSFRP